MPVPTTTALTPLAFRWLASLPASAGGQDRLRARPPPGLRHLLHKGVVRAVGIALIGLFQAAFQPGAVLLAGRAQAVHHVPSLDLQLGAAAAARLAHKLQALRDNVGGRLGTDAADVGGSLPVNAQ